MYQHKGELRDKVEERCAELQEELDAAELRGYPAERVEVLATELRIVEDALSGGWDCIGEVTSAQLARWLEATKHLISHDDEDMDERITAEIPVQHGD